MKKGRKIALIVGVTGQDGSLLADFLLKKNYKVFGLKRRSSTFNTKRIDHLYTDYQKAKDFIPIYGDLTDSTNLIRVVQTTKPDEIYNVGAQSHVHTSFETPEYTANADALGALRILEAIRILNLRYKTKFYQASTSEMFGDAKPPQNEKTIFRPRSPYAVSKLFAYWITVNYREAYKMFASNGILFNHEGPRRGETFVTRKITRAVSEIYKGKRDCFHLGNLDAKRDWGYAKDYVGTMWKMLQLKRADDFVIATGVSTSVRHFVEQAFKFVKIPIKWRGKGTREVGVNVLNNKVVVKIDPSYFRPTEVNHLQGNFSKARRILKWKPETKFKELVEIMMKNDLRNV